MQAVKSEKPFIIDVAVTPNQIYIPPKLEIGIPFRLAESSILQFVDKFLHKRTAADLHISQD